jgi:uncharacterized membrane-anchored protein
MAVGKNAMEIFSILDKSNCKKCGEKTCLAFAGAVYTGKRRIQECPNLTSADIARFSDESAIQNQTEDLLDEYISSMIQEVVRLDFALVAERIGARLNGNELTVPVLGKKFGIRLDGFVCNRSSYHSLGSVYRT